MVFRAGYGALCLLLSVVYAFAQNDAFHGYQVLSVNPRHSGDVRLLQDLEEKYPVIDFWSEPWPGQNASVLLPPDLSPVFKQQVQRVGMSAMLISNDVNKLARESSKRTPSHVVRRRKAAAGHVVDHHNYHNYKEYKTYLDTLRQAYPANMEMSTLPRKTVEGREMPVVKLSGQNSKEAKSVVIVESGIHAREWIAPATALFLMEKMLQEHRQGINPAKMMLDQFDWYFIPLANPDGYEFSHSSSDGRYWRKNRNPQTDPCVGVDLNRNFDVAFGTSTRRNWCDSGSYPGKKAFSEQESKNIRDLFEELQERVIAFVSLHSKGQFLIIPWAYTSSKKPDNIDELNRVGSDMMAAVRERHRTDYTYGTAYSLLHYSATGTSLDWTLQQKPGIYVYNFELRPKRNDPRAYMLPAEEIVPTGEEVYASVGAMAQSIKNPLFSVAEGMRGNVNYTSYINNREGPGNLGGKSQSDNIVLILCFVLAGLIRQWHPFRFF
ncbi:zinc carboxypeptidase isoform X2 [Aplysia californica]|nr:zinc carboxypeptidase isoform X2 [Aplysia californica]